MNTYTINSITNLKDGTTDSQPVIGVLVTITISDGTNSKSYTGKLDPAILDDLQGGIESWSASRQVEFDVEFAPKPIQESVDASTVTLDPANISTIVASLKGTPAPEVGGGGAGIALPP